MSSFEFCENGAKAATWEATAKRVDPEFFAMHSVTDLWEWSDHALEDAGRLTHPLRYDRSTDRFVTLPWDEAFARIGDGRSEERRVGEECVRTWRSRWSPCP